MQGGAHACRGSTCDGGGVFGMEATVDAVSRSLAAMPHYKRPRHRASTHNDSATVSLVQGIGVHLLNFPVYSVIYILRWWFPPATGSWLPCASLSAFLRDNCSYSVLPHKNISSKMITHVPARVADTRGSLSLYTTTKNRTSRGICRTFRCPVAAVQPVTEQR